jgi:acetylglutamate kinase
LLVLADDQGLHDASGLCSQLPPDQVAAGLDRGRFSTSADEFLAFARHAATQGLPALHLVDGRVPHALVAELFTDQGVGTLVTRQALAKPPLS